MVQAIVQKTKKRFQFFCWPLTPFEQSVELRRDDFPLKKKAKEARYPFRALRYWWASCAIREEVQRLQRPPLIVDMGCEGGLMKRFASAEGARWIGLDRNIGNPSLALAGYDALHACDFEERLPLPEGVVDIVVCLHVFEHLPQPEFTMGEIARILRPGGILLAGSPVLPRWLALWRERVFRREIAAGKRRRGDHIRCFWKKRWYGLAEGANLRVEFVSGSFLLRWTGNPLENFRWWMRLNQIWGALFPSLGQEIYLQARSGRGPSS